MTFVKRGNCQDFIEDFCDHIRRRKCTTNSQYIEENILCSIDEKFQSKNVQGYRAHIDSLAEITPAFDLTDIDAIKKEMKASKEFPLNGFALNNDITYNKLYHWLGFGLSFFIENPEMAYLYAQEILRRNRGIRPWFPLVIFEYNFPQGICLNLTKTHRLFFQQILDDMIKFDKKRLDELVESHIELRDKTLEIQHIYDCIIISFLEFFYQDQRGSSKQISTVISVLVEDSPSLYFPIVGSSISRKTDMISALSRYLAYNEIKITPEYLRLLNSHDFITENHINKPRVTQEIAFNQAIDLKKLKYPPYDQEMENYDVKETYPSKNEGIVSRILLQHRLEFDRNTPHKMGNWEFFPKDRVVIFSKTDSDILGLIFVTSIMKSDFKIIKKIMSSQNFFDYKLNIIYDKCKEFVEKGFKNKRILCVFSATKKNQI